MKRDFQRVSSAMRARAKAESSSETVLREADSAWARRMSAFSRAGARTSFKKPPANCLRSVSAVK